MKAAVIDRYGSPEVFAIRDVAKPVPKNNEVLIRVHAAVATPSDCAFRSAKPFIVRLFAGLFRPKFNILGDTIAGEVAAVGQDVARFRVGDRVVGTAGVGLGSYAEFCTVSETDALVTMPPDIDYAAAASVCEAFLTAMPFLRDEARLRGGERVLINGASGSVGSCAVQLAKYFGAHVTGVCSGRNIELVKGLGADRVIDYAREDFSAESGRYDVIFDAVGKSSFAKSARALTQAGLYMTTVPSAEIAWLMLTGRKTSKGRRALLATTGLRPPGDKAKDLLLMRQLIEDGVLRPVIDRHYALDQIADAHRYVETGRKRGSVVIDIAGE